MSKNRKTFIALVEKAMAEGEKMAPEELMFTYKGILYPATVCSPEIFKALESFEARSDDVILAGYPKSGTNWVGQILTDLVDAAAKNNEDTNSADDEAEEFPYLEVGDPEKYQRMANLPSRRVMFTHLVPRNLPTSVFKNKAKMLSNNHIGNMTIMATRLLLGKQPNCVIVINGIYEQTTLRSSPFESFAFETILLLIRNPKDVATSFYHFSNGLAPLPSYPSLDEYFNSFMSGQMPWGSYFDYVSEWNEHADDENIMTITYEELKENRALGVKRISEFFEFNLTEQEIQEIVDKSSFQAMKENCQKTHGELGKVLFRKGGVSDWKNLFNEDHNQEMDTTFEERLGGTKLGEKIKYGVYCKA